MSRSADSIELQALLEPLTTDTARPPPFLTQQLYENLPLHPGSRCIRLLRLHCNYKQPHAPLTGELSVVDLRSSPSFAALSYVWGDISYPRPTITCQGCQFELTNNCRDALLALRDQFGEILIWVDAICINQNDTAEKGEQVSLCSEIYSWARTVYIWLGNDDDNESARKAIECLETAVGFSIVPPQAPHFAIHQKKNIFRGKVALLIKIMAAEYFYVPFGRPHFCSCPLL
ncbi:hypothetical protein MMC10_003564 [Thelotrema lepadinum]|nr:hypothetical protein [Thelotrema lepadinum]